MISAPGPTASKTATGRVHLLPDAVKFKNSCAFVNGPPGQSGPQKVARKR